MYVEVFTQEDIQKIVVSMRRGIVPQETSTWNFVGGHYERKVGNTKLLVETDNNGGIKVTYYPKIGSTLVNCFTFSRRGMLEEGKYSRQVNILIDKIGILVLTLANDKRS